MVPLPDEIGSDVLEGQEAARLDFEYLLDVDGRPEGQLEPIRVRDHLEQRIHALHLGIAQVVARPAFDRIVPPDVEVGEERKSPVADLREQVVRRKFAGQVNRVRTFELPVPQVEARQLRLIGKDGRAGLPSGQVPVEVRGVGVWFPGALPGQRRSLVLWFIHEDQSGPPLRQKCSDFGLPGDARDRQPAGFPGEAILPVRRGDRFQYEIWAL